MITERSVVVGYARQAMYAQVRYLDGDEEDIPAHVLSQAARRAYIQGDVGLETFEWFLDLQFGLLETTS